MENEWDLLKDNRKVMLGLNSYEFCPAKVLRDDQEALWIFKVLNAIIETNTWPKAGGLEDQDSFWIDLVAEFGPLKRDFEFQKKIEIVGKAIGGTEKGKSVNTHRG